MAKLNNKEIQDNINMEMGDNPLPRDAHSKFRFEIEESVDDLVRDMKERPKKYRRWKFIDFRNSEYKDIYGDYILQDPEYDNSYASVKEEEGKLSITTAWGGYNYEITPREKGGSNVEFSGPVNALLNQNLLPEMTYIPYTLEGKFVDRETGRDLTMYMDMQSYGTLRSLKNEQVIQDSFEYKMPGNSQDGYGHHINAQFNNEIPFLPKKRTAQELKQERAQKDFEEGKKAKVSEWKKERIKKHLDAVRGKLSGAVAADNIAEDKISGKEKRVITSEIGAELAAEIDPLEDIKARIYAAVDPDAPSTLKDGGVIAKGYHTEVDELRSIRDNTKGILAQLETRLRQETGIPKLKIGYNHVFGYFIEVSNSYKNLVPETYIRKQTLTSGERYITQELKELESKILGAHERLISLERRLFDELLESIGAQLDRIQRTANAIAQLDVLAALAQVAAENNYCRPVVDDSDVLTITEGRHPVVEQVLKGSMFVPNDTTLNCTTDRCLIITGPTGTNVNDVSVALVRA